MFLTGFINWVSGASKKVKAWLNAGKEVANEIKQYMDSPLLDVAVGLTSTKVDDAALKVIRVVLSGFIENVGWAELKLSTLDKDSKTVVLHSLSAVSSKAISDYQNGNLNIQTALTAAQIIYDEKQIVKV